MKTQTILATGCIVLAAAAVRSEAASLVLRAIDTASPASDTGGTDVDADNRLRAYAVDDTRIDGWMKFATPAAALPGPVMVTQATLVLYAEGSSGGFAGSSGAPVLEVWFSSFDGWTRGGSAFPVPEQNLLPAGDSGPFTVGNRTAYEIELPVAALDWNAQLGAGDGQLSLVLRLSGGSEDAWVYWYGSGERPGDLTVGGAAGDDPVLPEGWGEFSPELRLEYLAVPEPAALSLGLAGTTLLLLRRRRTPGRFRLSRMP